MSAAASQPPRIVAIGDLNGAIDALVEILRGTGLINRIGRWSGGRTHLVQLGDVFNRGDGAREVFELLERLGAQARAAGGDVSVLLGNHEVLTTLGNEAYCTLGEYLSFATRAERLAWPARVRRAYLRLHREYPDGGPIPPALPRLELWKAEHVPGRDSMRRALTPSGRLGKLIRRLPVAVRIGDAVFTHAGIVPAWARLGIDGINAEVRRAWLEAPAFWADLSPRSILRAPGGPLHVRKLAQGRGPEVESALARSLELLDARRMVVGHTMTRSVPGGRPGRIACRFRGRLVCVDVGLRSGEGEPRAALVIEDGSGWEWTPAEQRPLWRDGARMEAGEDRTDDEDAAAELGGDDEIDEPSIAAG